MQDSLTVGSATLKALSDILTCTGFQGQKILDGEAFVVRKETMDRMKAAHDALYTAYMADMQAAIDARAAARV